MNRQNPLAEQISSGNYAVPKYQMLKETILGKIITGTWAPGMLIPAEPELCQQFGVSRITVRHAIGDLVHEGRLRTVQGKGTFVAAPKLEERFVQRVFGLYEDMERRGLHLTTEVIRQEVVPASSDVATCLGIAEGERVHVLVRVRSVEEEKLLISTTYIPERLCPELANDDLSTGSLYQLLRTRYGLTLYRGKRTLEAIAAGQWEARLLDLALASPLLRLNSIAYLQNGQAFEYSQALHRGDRALIELEFISHLDEQ